MVDIVDAVTTHQRYTSTAIPTIHWNGSGQSTVARQCQSFILAANSPVPRQLPRRGDELEVLRPHAGPVFALAAPARPLAVSGSGGPLLVSGSWDGSTAEFGRAGCAATLPHITKSLLSDGSSDKD